MAPSLTSHLLALDPNALKEATQHPFLQAAATQSLPLPQLKAWLGQDRLYQMAYLPFIGSMLSRINIPATAEREAPLSWRAADLLIDSLTNIREEMRLFEQTADGEGWLEEISNLTPEVQTRAYQDLFAGACAQGRPLLVGLCVLWATEKCYLQAWKWSKGQVKEGLEDEEMDVMQRVFIAAWTSGEFEKFVDRIGGFVDEFAGVFGKDSWEWRECEVVWRQVLWAEREFWPKVE